MLHVLPRVGRAALGSRTCTTLSSSHTLYCVRSHSWLRRVGNSGHVRIGLTERALDDIGEVAGVEYRVANGDRVG